MVLAIDTPSLPCLPWHSGQTTHDFGPCQLIETASNLVNGKPALHATVGFPRSLAVKVVNPERFLRLPLSWQL